MSRSSRFPTIQQEPQLCLVVVAGGLALIGAVRQAAEKLTSAEVLPTDAAGAANLVSQRRPFAIVIGQLAYEADAGEFDALARDVRAPLVVAPARATEVQLMDLLVPQLTEALRAALS